MGRKTAFTLLELLIVVAIISLLASLLIPAVGTAKEQAWRVACKNNQRSLSLTWMLYAEENREMLPQNGYTIGGGETWRNLWIQGHLNPALKPGDCTNELLLIDRRFSQFAPYLPSSKVYRCPANREPIQVLGLDGKLSVAVANVRSYSMNWFLGWVDDPISRNPPAELRRFHTTSALQPASPSELLVFTDVHPKSICWPFFGIQARAEFFNLPGSYHKRRGIIAWADGHVNEKKWADARTTGAVADEAALCVPGFWHKHQHLSPDNADLAWLQTHGSIPR